MTGLRTQATDEPWVEEKVISGSASFGENRVIYLSRTNEVTFGFSAQYSVEDGRMTLKLETSTFEGLEGQTIYRDIEQLDQTDLLLTGEEVETCRKIELRFRR